MTEEEKEKIAITTGSWVRLVVVLALAYAFIIVANFILILIASIVVASAVEPITLWTKRKGMPRVPTVISIYIITAIFLSGFFYFLLLPLLGEVGSFIKTLTVYSNALTSGNVLSTMFENQNVFGGLDTPAIVSQVSMYLNEWSQFLSKGIFSSLAAVSGGVISFILFVVLSFYLAVQEEGITKFLRIITPLNHESYVISLWRRSQLKIGRWMQGQVFLGAIVMVLVYLGLLILGVPHALLLAVVSGVFELIPLFGPVLAAIPAVFITYATQDMSMALLVAGLYLVIQQFENHIIYPLVVKRVIGMPPIVSIMALVIGGQLGGFLGLVVSVPVAAVVMEFLSDHEEHKIAKLSAQKSN
ncbi:MAG: AI-2E family transporter [Patescibacteria group bacterium]